MHESAFAVWAGLDSCTAREGSTVGNLELIIADLIAAFTSSAEAIPSPIFPGATTLLSCMCNFVFAMIFILASGDKL